MVEKRRNKIKLQESFRDEIALRNNLFVFSQPEDNRKKLPQRRAVGAFCNFFPNLS